MWTLVAVGALTAVAGFLYLAFHPSARLDSADKAASVMFGSAGFLVATVSLYLALRPVQVDPETGLVRAQEALARQVARQWERESAARGLTRPDPLPVRWAITSRPVTARQATTGRTTRRRPGPPTRGDVTTLAATWRRMPAGQLVVLGAPGSGKTSSAALLVRDLLTDRHAGEPVPVLVPLAGWTPAEHLDTWLARRLATDYPVLTDTAAYAPRAPGRLVERRLVLPVLDGLDELPTELHSSALAAINATFADRPWVLTCRSTEYAAAVTAVGAPLARAAVIELSPLTATELADYLPAAQLDGPARWAPVLAALRASPAGPLAAVLSTPLNAYLARTAYAVPGSDPTALLSPAEPAELEAHLLASYLPALYPAVPPPTAPGDRPTPAYAASQAARWFRYLARHLDQRGTRNLAWWDLITALPSRTLATLVGLTVGLACLLLFALSDTPTLGPRMGAVLAVIVYLDVSLTVARPHHLALRLKSFTPVLATAVAAGVACGAAASQIPGMGRGSALSLGLGLAIGLGVRWGKPAPTSALIDPTESMRMERGLLLTSALVGGAVGAVLYGLLGGLPALQRAVGPLGPGGRLLAGFAIGVMLGTTVALMARIGRLWVGFVVARGWLTVRRRLPWRLMPFLHDAHRRGVLRQVGAQYQFRHARLQQYLAGTDGTTGPT
ncbi:hypothetical protein GCM10027280_53970 [Micromonospora polyrhachis]